MLTPDEDGENWLRMRHGNDVSGQSLRIAVPLPALTDSLAASGNDLEQRGTLAMYSLAIAPILGCKFTGLSFVL